jgi:ankyrin repeat protein
MQLLSAYVKVSQDTETYQVLLNKGLIQAYASDAVDDVLDTLTKLGAQFNVEGNILHKLATPGYSSPKAIERAIKNGANPNARDSNNRTPFCWAIEDFYINNAQDVQRAIDIIDALVRNGAKVDPLDITSDNLLIQAILPGKDIFLPLVRKLCELGVNINAKTRTGDTTLSLAAERWNDATAVKILIEAGADPFERNSQGKSALDVAVELGKSEHVDALLSTTKPYLPSAIQMALRNALKKDNPVKGTLKNRYFQKIGHEKRA